MAKQKELRKPTLAEIAAQNPGFVAVPDEAPREFVFELINMGYRVLVVHEIVDTHYRFSEHFLSSMSYHNVIHQKEFH